MPPVSNLSTLDLSSNQRRRSSPIGTNGKVKKRKSIDEQDSTKRHRIPIVDHFAYADVLIRPELLHEIKKDSGKT